MINEFLGIINIERIMEQLPAPPALPAPVVFSKQEV